MKLRLILIAIFAALGIAQAQQVAVSYDFGSKEVLYLGVQPLRVEHDLFGIRGFDVQVSGIGGLGAQWTGGFAVTAPLKLTRETALDFGVYWRLRDGEKPMGGVVAWFSRRL